jgi:hypothetical protein
MSELQTFTADSQSLSILASVSSRESASDLEELPSAESSTATESLSTEVEVGSVIVPAKTDSLSEATLADVEVTSEETNPTRKPKTGALDTSVECTRLKTIKGAAPAVLSVSQLRSFCSRAAITGTRKSTKIELCRKICIAKAILDLDVAKGEVKGEKKPKKSTNIIAGPVVIKRKRLCNVLFSDKVRPKLATRAKSLTKEELTSKTKAGEELFKLVADEYNDSSKYNEDAFPHLTGFNSKQGDPSTFAPIDWKKAKVSFGELMKDYENYFQLWKLPGFHDDFGQVPKQPFSDYAKGAKSLLYVHEFVFQNPGIFDTVTGQLPPGAFSESIGGNKSADKKSGGTTSKGKASKATGGTNLEMDRFTVITEAKNASIECALANETAVNCSKYVADLRVRYKDLNSTFRTHCKGKKPANKRVKAFKANQSKKAKAQIDAAKNGLKDPFGSDSSDSSDSEPEDSQESLIEEICSVKGDLDDFEMRKVAALKREDESRIKIQNLKKDSVYE